MIKKIRLCILVAIGLIMLVLIYSYRNPGKIRMVDKLRVPTQAAIMAHLSDYNFVQLGILNESTVSNNHSLNIHELTPYLETLQPGDILFTNNEKYLSSQFIPGEWKHAVIYLGSSDTLVRWFGKKSTVTQALKASGLSYNNFLIYDSSVDGVGIRHIGRLSNLKDRSMLAGMAAFRINKDHESIKAFISHAFSHIGKDYDYDLLTGDTEALYCSELVYESLKHIGILLPVEERFFGREVVSPEGAVQYMLHKGIRNGEFELLFMLKSPGNMSGL